MKFVINPLSLLMFATLGSSEDSLPIPTASPLRSRKLLSPEDYYSESFIYKHVFSSTSWIAPHLGANTNSITVTFRFENSLRTYDGTNCQEPFTEEMQELTRDIFRELEGILTHIKFKEVASSNAKILYVMCENLASTINANGISQHYGHKATVRMDSQIARNLDYASVGSIIGMDLSGFVRRLLSHETGHSLGLRHTHNKGEGANTGIQTGYTARSSVMSYLDSPCEKKDTSFSFLPFFMWQKLPIQRSGFGPVDIINLRYAYDSNAPSIKYNQTDETFPCNLQDPSFIPTYYLSPETQAAIGAGLAVFACLTRYIKRKAEEDGVTKLACAAKAAQIVLDNMPPERADDATTLETMKNATIDVCIAAFRMTSPVGAFTYDMTTYLRDGSSYKEKCGDLFLRTLSYSLARLTTIPIDTAYQHTLSESSRQKAESAAVGSVCCTLQVAKHLSRLVTNLSGVRHIVPSPVYKFANNSPPPPPPPPPRESDIDLGSAGASSSWEAAPSNQLAKNQPDPLTIGSRQGGGSASSHQAVILHGRESQSLSWLPSCGQFLSMSHIKSLCR